MVNRDWIGQNREDIAMHLFKSFAKAVASHKSVLYTLLRLYEVTVATEGLVLSVAQLWKDSPIVIACVLTLGLLVLVLGAVACWFLCRARGNGWLELVIFKGKEVDSCTKGVCRMRRRVPQGWKKLTNRTPDAIKRQERTNWMVEDIRGSNGSEEGDDGGEASEQCREQCVTDGR